MDTRNGDIIRPEFLDKIEAEDKPYVRPMMYHPTPKQRATGRVGRNDPCPCGSGKKFKRCCLFGATQPPKE